MSDRWFYVWFVFCGLLALAITGLLAWALIEFILWVRSQ